MTDAEAVAYSEQLQAFDVYGSVYGAVVSYALAFHSHSDSDITMEAVWVN